MTAGLKVRDGFGIVEAVVALMLLAIVLSALLPAFAMNLRTNTINELRTTAVAVAQQELDNICAGADLPDTGTTVDVNAGLAVFQALYTHDDYCEGSTCFAGAREIALEVSHNGRSLYRVRTVFTSLDGSGT